MVALLNTPELPRNTVICGDCLAELWKMPDCSVDAIVTDPPAGINFMNMQFDSDKGGRDNWIAWLTEVMKEALRVIRPGGHAFVWALPRTSHWTATALEDAGWEIREVVVHLFGNGFPKSLDISKAIDRMRDDSPDVLAVTKWLNKQVKRVGISYSVILAHFGFNEGSGQIGHWTALSNGAQPTVPTWEQWLELKSLLNFSDEMDSEVWRLNGRKGKPGDTWYDREVLQERTMIQGGGNALQIRMGQRREVEANITAPATPEAARYAGYGSALKPSNEHWILCRKPLSEPTIAQNVLKWNGCGGLNIDKCRIGTQDYTGRPSGQSVNAYEWSKKPNPMYGQITGGNPQGRWPSNTLFSHTLLCRQTGVKRVRGNTPVGHKGNSTINDYGKYNHRSEVTHGMEETIDAWECSDDCPVRILGEQSGVRKSGGGEKHPKQKSTFMASTNYEPYKGTSIGGDTGTAARYFAQFSPSPDELEVPFIYSSKASRSERNRGCEGLPENNKPDAHNLSSNACSRCGLRVKANGSGKKCECGPLRETIKLSPTVNSHPTVKPLALCRYLARLITPPNGVILDPFMGSGSTGVAALQEGFSFIGIDSDASYVEIARARIQHALQEAGIAEVQGDGEWICSDDCPVKILGEQSGVSKSNVGNRGKAWSSTGTHEGWKRPVHEKYQSGVRGHEDEGTAARFFAQFAPDSLWSLLEDEGSEL